MIRLSVNLGNQMVIIPFLLGMASLSMILSAVIIMTISYHRFLKSEFKKILKWLLFALYSMAVPYTLFMMREMIPLGYVNEIISWVIFFFMIIMALCLVKASLILNQFSKTVGFKDTEKRFKEVEKRII